MDMSFYLFSVQGGIYLIPVRDMRATTFLDALSELSCRRAQPTFLYSDNGTYFTKTAKLLDKMEKYVKMKGALTCWNKFISDHSLSVYNLPEKSKKSNLTFL